ncbi:hypothetical protein LEMA_P109420.1 [Plenodomus lingam JN3]|uniref:F-box domain-containing protein n=1 Tax=Leptosphaeria maculans (strain JN3 / isolate v23.1.3 / race Av1-4-5-6-7-8) TaxID=985895 RepID=E4ZZ82_LEPMJ|nr:hypothetical protein LEMA_P109420.1 [Plenodomus lingam JN3]CBX96677.1 hypothetical protein LEMA_P109420.1 [Plenodomus lingam JN3]
MIPKKEMTHALGTLQRRPFLPSFLPSFLQYAHSKSHNHSFTAGMERTRMPSAHSSRHLHGIGSHSSPSLPGNPHLNEGAMIPVSPPHTTMDSLPNEILIQVASHLDINPPSISKFRHEPTPQLTISDAIPLKCLSQVSRRWRKIVLPILFRYCRIGLDPEPQWVPVDARLVDSMQGQLTRLSNHEFMIYTRMRSKFKSSSASAYEENFDDLLINLCRIQDGDEFLKSAPRILWLPHLPKSFAGFERFVQQHMLKYHIKGVVVHTNQEYVLRHVSTSDAPLSRAVNEIWSQVFSLLEPARLVVAAPPSALATLLDTQIECSNPWTFAMKTHYIELRQPDPTPLEHMTTKCRPWDSALIHKRPWYHLGYNEGSSIAANGLYDSNVQQSPNMLCLTLVRLARETQPCCAITSVEFTGVFPFAINITKVLHALHRIPTLKKGSIQIAPGPENDLLSNRRRMYRAQTTDLWLEWRESYKMVTSYLGIFDFPDGAEFISLDCESAQMAAEVREYMGMLRRRGTGWREEGTGRWVRDHGLDGTGASPGTVGTEA